MLRELVEQHGTKAWAKIASIMRTKGSKQCRCVELSASSVYTGSERCLVSALCLLVREDCQHHAH